MLPNEQIPITIDLVDAEYAEVVDTTISCSFSAASMEISDFLVGYKARSF
jgi:hypothetical protein